MPERPKEPLYPDGDRLRPELNDMADPKTTTPSAVATPSQAARRSWTAVLGIELPDGTVRHPRLLERLENEIGPCISDSRDAGVRLCFDVDGSTAEEARVDASRVAARVLDILGLSLGSIVEEHVAPPPPRYEQPTLRLVGHHHQRGPRTYGGLGSASKP